jgi:hypothetical protein
MKIMINRDHPAFKKEAEPFYNIIMKGLKGEVDGEHFWDAVAQKVHGLVRRIQHGTSFC